jgi:hypothetical protein
VEEVCWPQLEVVSILKNRSRTISFCEWNSLLLMEGLRYCVVFGDAAESPVCSKADVAWN